MSNLNCNCVERALCRLFDRHGRIVARNPLPFIIVPTLMTGLLLIGLLNIDPTDDTQYLYTPINGPAKGERKVIQENFPENHTSGFSSSRISEIGGELNVIVKLKSGGNLLTPGSGIFQKIVDLDAAIQSQPVTINGMESTYPDICASFRGQCHDNFILSVHNRSGQLVGNIPITYPIFNMTFLGFVLGDVTLTDAGVVSSANVMLLSYYGKYVTEEVKKNTDKWLSEMQTFFSKYDDSELSVSYSTSLSLDEELAGALGEIVPLFSITYTILSLFSELSLVMTDWVRSMPWLGFYGVLAAAGAAGSGLGLMSAVGVPFATTVGSMPFLIIGIGIDDMFVIMSSWRHTDVRKSVEDRMGETFSTAAVSITLTSITDALAFGIGAITTFRAVTFFCAYTGVAVIFCYIYVNTFFAACLVYEGRREAKNLHVATCQKAIPKNDAEDRSDCYRFWCTGGLSSKGNDEGAQDGIVNPWLTIFMWRRLGPLIVTTPAKIVIICLYALYIGFSVWGCVSLKEGLQVENLAPDNSYLVGYYEDFHTYFYEIYGPSVMVVITESVDYSDDSTRDKVYAMLRSFRESEVFYNNPNLTISWLNATEQYLESINANPSSLPEYISVLRGFLSVAQIYSLDVNINEAGTEITSSRFLIQATGIDDTLDERKLMLEARRLARKAEFDVTVYAPGFIYFDQFTVIVANTAQNIAIAVACMLFVSVFLVPNVTAVICIVFSVTSICAGVIGFMVFWDVNLDSISMINLIMCIGFSVDFSAHISYHFAISENPSGNARAIEAVGQLGTPIVQGAISTILGVAILGFSNTYIFRTFAKIISLVMIFGFLHSMFLLPVVLSTIHDIKAGLMKKDSRSRVANDMAGSIEFRDPE